MISAIIYIENTTFDWTAVVSDFSTHFLLSKAELSLVSKGIRLEVFDTPDVLEQPRDFPHLGGGEK